MSYLWVLTYIRGFLRSSPRTYPGDGSGIVSIIVLVIIIKRCRYHNRQRVLGLIG